MSESDHGGCCHTPVSKETIVNLSRYRRVLWVALVVKLYAFREGDANMRSVWLCSRNDAIGNVAVFLVALGVLGTGSAWPDLLVAAASSATRAANGAPIAHAPH